MRVRVFILVLSLAAGGSLAAAEPTPSAYVGAGSCSAFGCHGNTAWENDSVWKSSYVQWARRDPHTRAFRSLFSPRSAEMVRLLSADAGLAVGELPGQPPPSLDRDAYWRVVESRCIGCHATPTPDHQPGRSGGLPDFDQLAVWAEGVSCESCHGAARPWLDEHATTRWPQYSSLEKTNRWKFTDTGNLASRAATCVACHVGPRSPESPDRAYDVDHTLIAAGHPRLTFEFGAYLANLPSHWDVPAERQRHGATEYDTRVWRIGQLVSAGKLAEQLAVRAPSLADAPETAALLDLTHYDCQDCHHRLQAVRFARPGLLPAGAAGRGHPRPADGPFRYLRAVAAGGGEEALQDLDPLLAEASRRMAFGESADAARAGQSLWNQLHERLAAIASEKQLEVPQPTAVRVNGVHRLAKLVQPGTARWDDLVQLQLALVALGQDEDLGEQRIAAVREIANRLADYLNGQFGDGSPSPYDTPSQFDPTRADLAALLQSVAAATASLDETPAGKPAP